MKNIIAINGSVRTQSSNGCLIDHVRDVAAGRFSMDVYNELASLPHFSPDADGEDPPAAVRDFRTRLKNADGIFICTPEYAHGVPGTLKNAIDWTVSSMELYGKPAALITASSSGHHGHAAMLEIFAAIGVVTNPEIQLLIPFVKTKLDNNGNVKDPAVIESIAHWISSLEKLLDDVRTDEDVS